MLLSELLFQDNGRCFVVLSHLIESGARSMYLYALTMLFNALRDATLSLSVAPNVALQVPLLSAEMGRQSMMF